MTNEIYIENYRVDLSASISSLLTYAIDDVKDFAARNTTFSKTIVLPGTTRNNIIFGNIFNVEVVNPYNSSQSNVNTNFNAAVSARCIIFQDHVQLFKGTLRLLEIIITDGVPEYEVFVSGELAGLITTLGSKKLEELDFSAYNHTWTHGNITASWDAARGTGYFYPLIDYGLCSTAKLDWDIQAFKPAMYVAEYLDKILTQNAYRYTSALFASSRFKNLVIPFNRKQLISQNRDFLDVRRVGTAAITTNGLIPFANQVTMGNFVESGTDTLFTYTTGADSPTGVLSFTLGGKYWAVSAQVDFELRINGVAVKSGFLASTGGTTDTDFTLLITDTRSILVSDVVSVYLSSSSSSWSVKTGGDRKLTFLIDTATTVPLAYGETIVMNTSIPQNIKQIDFVSSIMKLFNLYLYESNADEKKLFIEPYTDFYDLNVSGIIDWTKKIDRSKPIRLKLMSELSARYYDFKFKPDTDYYNELYKKRYNNSYGNHVYDAEFEFADARSGFEIIFSPTPLLGFSGKDKIVSVMYKYTNGTEEQQDVNIRILQVKKMTGKAAWDIKDGASVKLAGLTVYGYGGHYDDPDAPANDIHFGIPSELFFTLAAGAVNVTQFNTYWSAYMAEISDKDSKLYCAFAKLTARDIFNLDFSKLIYCDGTFWRLNKIEDYNATMPDVCKIELLSVINLIY